MNQHDPSQLSATSPTGPEQPLGTQSELALQAVGVVYDGLGHDDTRQPAAAGHHQLDCPDSHHRSTQTR